ncbi:PREDICTED: uncharacterized protein LOC109244987 [Nicotiana attenuata]|uniref:uncharacterized protein LOC109244987 n=1 Tax=Nicotiana attenuata TaxID=49451 RepID=UPI0009059EC0|nr:PREDICTED: uncharacterized protein LOC109244987 [Nicotiana attenuata]
MRQNRRNIIRCQDFPSSRKDGRDKVHGGRTEAGCIFRRILRKEVPFRNGTAPGAQSHEDMTGIPMEVAVHKLSLDPNVPPVRQKKRLTAEARNKFVKEEETRLLNIGSIREVRYPDWLANVVVVPNKNKKFCDHLTHLQETFDILRKHNMKLNPEKCAFGVSSSKFLEFLVSQKGFEVNPDKIKAIEDILDQLPRAEEVQRLTGRLAAVSRFISRSSKKYHCFFALHKKKNDFEWTPECQQALRDLKRYLSSPPLLSKPKEGEILTVYLAVSEVAVSAVLVCKDKGTQSPIYYVRKIIMGAETCYPHLEKLALALIVAARKLRPYFQCHPIVVVTTFPLRNILHKPELSGRLAIKISEFDIEYKPMTAIKSGSGLTSWPISVRDYCLWQPRRKQWCRNQRQEFGPYLRTRLQRKRVRTWNSLNHDFGRNFEASHQNNNEAEYEALNAGLELARGLNSEVIKIKCDSELVVNQVYGIFDAKEERMQQYRIKFQALLARFQERSITYIPREDNTEADVLANLGSSTKIKGTESGAVVQLINSILDADGYYKVNSTSLVWDWRNEIIDYVEHEKLLEDPKASRALRAKATRYCFKRGQLYGKSFQGPLAQCLGTSEANYFMRQPLKRRFLGAEAGTGRILLSPHGPGRQRFHTKM